MAQIIVYGDTAVTPLYLTVDSDKEIRFSSGKPERMSIRSGTHQVIASSMSSFRRTLNSSGGLGTAINNSTESTMSGDVTLDDDDVLLLKITLRGLKTTIEHIIVGADEVDDYLDEYTSSVSYEGAPEGKNKWVAFFLCFFFGCLGIHRFYEGKIGTGFLFLFTLGLFGFGAIYDLIRIWRW